MGLEHCSTSLEAVASQQTLLQGVEETFNFLSQSTTLTMGSNNVRQYGGAVYVKDSYPLCYCFPDRTNLESALFKLMGLTEFRVIFAIHFFLIQQLPVLKFCIRMSPLDMKLDQFSTSV